MSEMSLATLGASASGQYGPPVLSSPTGVPNLTKAMVGVMRQVREIRKEGENKTDKYAYVYFGDVLAAVQDALVMNGLMVTQREVGHTIIGRTLFVKYQFDLYHESGEYLINASSHTGSCRFEFKSGTTDDKAANKALQSGLKYGLLALFKIPPADHHMERVSDGDVDAQDQNYDPERGNRDQQERRDDRRDEPRQDQRDEPRNPPTDRPDDRDDRRDNPPPPEDVFHGPPSNRFDEGSEPRGEQSRHDNGRPPADDRERNHRANVTEFARKLRNATTEGDAGLIWKDNSPVLRACNDSTYEFLREEYLGRWNINPPRVD